MRNNYLPVTMSYLFWISLTGSIVFAVSRLFIDAYLTPKWISFGFWIIAILFSSVWPLFGDRKIICQFTDMKTVSDAICIVLSAQALYGILQYAGLLPQTSAFRVSGSYDNPAGFAAVLCSGLPFVMTGLMHKARQTRCLHIAGTGIMIVAIILSRSRSGLMALLAVFALGELQFVNRKLILKCAMLHL